MPSENAMGRMLSALKRLDARDTLFAHAEGPDDVAAAPDDVAATWDLPPLGADAYAADPLDADEFEADELDTSPVSADVAQLAEVHDEILFEFCGAPCGSQNPPPEADEAPRLTATDAERPTATGDEVSHAAPPVDPQAGAPDPPAARSDPALERIATALLRKLPAGLPASVWVASCADAADASDVVAALARHYTADGQLSVLAVDGQCHRAGQANRASLADVLTGKATWREAVCATEIEGLSIIAGGLGPASHVGSADGSLSNMLDKACRAFDLVVVDGGQHRSPATLRLAPQCDASVVLVRLGQTERRAARDAAESLQQAGATVAGCVVLKS